MAVIGLIVLSCVLMLFKGGITGVILLWGFAIWKWVQSENEHQRNLEKYEKAKKEFKKKERVQLSGLYVIL